MLASEIVKIPGASKFLEFSIVSYGEYSKKSILKISELNKFSVVSAQIAESMAKKNLQYTKSKNILSLSCTGYAGPNINEEKLLGTVFIGLKYLKKIRVYKKKFHTKKRLEIIKSTVEFMLIKANEFIS